MKIWSIQGVNYYDLYCPVYFHCSLHTKVFSLYCWVVWGVWGGTLIYTKKNHVSKFDTFSLWNLCFICFSFHKYIVLDFVQCLTCEYITFLLLGVIPNVPLFMLLLCGFDLLKRTHSCNPLLSWLHTVLRGLE